MKPQFSKLIVIVASILFIFALAHGAIKTYAEPTTVITEISATGTAFLTVCVWYYKKASTENTAKIRIEHAKEVAELEYTYFEKRAKLMKELELTEADIYKIKEESMLDELESSAINEDVNYLSNQFENNSSDPEIQRMEV